MIKKQAGMRLAHTRLFLLLPLFLCDCFFHIITYRFFSQFDAGYIRCASDQMASYRRSDEQENNRNDQLGVKMIFNQPEVDERSTKYTHDTECRAFRSRVSPCIHIGKTHKPKCRDGTENDACADQNNYEDISDCRFDRKSLLSQ